MKHLNRKLNMEHERSITSNGRGLTMFSLQMLIRATMLGFLLKKFLGRVFNF